MLEHQKKVLLGVAKNPYLFKKELIKSFSWLNAEEVDILYKWVKKEFDAQYSQLIAEISCEISA